MEARNVGMVTAGSVQCETPMRSAIISPCAADTDCRGGSNLSRNISTVIRVTMIGDPATTLPQHKLSPSFASTRRNLGAIFR